MPLAQSIKQSSAKQASIMDGNKLSMTNPASKMTSKLKYYQQVFEGGSQLKQ